ncbi:MAG: hypothetical protein WA383_14565 [Terriglobales bacterium]
MTADDKNAQIGAAVSDYQTAKVELAHIEQKIDKVFLAYREAGNTMDRYNKTPHEPTLENGRVKFAWYTKDVTAADILNEQDLAVLINERDTARVRLEHAKTIMTRLGITGVS